MLKASALRGKKRRFFEAIFSRRPPRSLAEAARQAGYPKPHASAIAGHWLKQFRELPEPMQAEFICELRILSGETSNELLKTHLEGLTYDPNHELCEQARKLRAILFQT